MPRITDLFAGLLANAMITFAQSGIDWNDAIQSRKAFETAAKNVRVLSPKSFRILPMEIVSVLERRHCQIPQDDTAYEGDVTNVVHGSFFTPNSSDWVVLCKGNTESYILVFREGNANHPFKLASEPILNSLEGVGNDRIGYVRRIRQLKPQKFATYYARGEARNVVLTHDAISDAMSDRFESVYYWKHTKWELVRSHASE